MNDNEKVPSKNGIDGEPPTVHGTVRVPCSIFLINYEGLISIGHSSRDKRFRVETYFLQFRYGRKVIVYKRYKRFSSSVGGEKRNSESSFACTNAEPNNRRFVGDVTMHKKG